MPGQSSIPTIHLEWEEGAPSHGRSLPNVVQREEDHVQVAEGGVVAVQVAAVVRGDGVRHAEGNDPTSTSNDLDDVRKADAID
jgi:hypothetical protein